MTEDNRPTWTDQLDGDLQGNEALTQFGTISDLGKAHIDLAGRSENSVQLPGENATDDDRNVFYGRLGRPEAPDKYVFNRPTMPEGLPYDEPGEAQMRQLMFDAGLSQTQAGKLYDEYNQNGIEGFNKLQAERMKYHNEQVGAFQKKWGDDYEANAEKAARVMAAFGGEEMTKWLEDSGLGDNPILLEFCYNVFEKIGEDSMVSGQRSRGTEGMSAADVLYPEMNKGD